MNNIYEDLSQDDLVTRLIEAETLIQQITQDYQPDTKTFRGTLGEAVFQAAVVYRRKHRV